MPLIENASDICFSSLVVENPSVLGGFEAKAAGVCVCVCVCGIRARGVYLTVLEKRKEGLGYGKCLALLSVLSFKPAGRAASIGMQYDTRFSSQEQGKADRSGGWLACIEQ